MSFNNKIIMKEIKDKGCANNLGASRRLLDTFLLLACLILSFALCWYFHDKGWLRRDAGYYGYVSQRLLEGDILHRDIQVLHAGLINFINTFFLKMSGGDLVGLRYPLIALTVVQSAIGYKLAKGNGYLAAITAVLVLTAFGFLQFINPTPNWYTMFFAIVLAWLLSSQRPDSSRKIILVGFTVGLIFLLRQLSGIYMAIAVTSIIFLKNPSIEGVPKPVAGRNVLAFLCLGLAIFVLLTGHWVGVILIGSGPTILLLLIALRCRVNGRDATRLILNLCLGSVLAALPLIVYNLRLGNLGNWFNDAILANISLAGMQMFDIYNYLEIPGFALISFIRGDLWALSGLLYWIFLLAVPLLLSVLLIHIIRKSNDTIPVSGIIACFYSLVSVIFETPIYLSYSTGIVLFALLTLEGLRYERIIVAACIITSVVAILFQAGENKQTLKFAATNTRLLETTNYIPGHSIKVGYEEALKYKKIGQLIDTCTFASDKIFAMPIHPEVYFLSNRQSAFRFLNSGLGLQTNEDVETQIEYVLNSNYPALILHNQVDVDNNSVLGQNLLDGVSHEFSTLGKIDEFTIYHRSSHSLKNRCANFQFD